MQLNADDLETGSAHRKSRSAKAFAARRRRSRRPCSSGGGAPGYVTDPSGFFGTSASARRVQPKT